MYKKRGHKLETYALIFQKIFRINLLIIYFSPKIICFYNLFPAKLDKREAYCRPDEFAKTNHESNESGTS